MRRREFISFLGTAAAWPIAATAQQTGAVRKVGVLMGVANDSEGQARVLAFRHGLAEWGWTEPRNIRLEVRFADGDAGRARTYAMELLALAPDVVMVNTSIALAQMQQATRTVPIVFAQVLDPVGGGFVASLANPGGNITGFASYETTMAGKWVEMLKELDPRIIRALVVLETDNATQPPLLRVIEDVARVLNVEIVPISVRNAAEIEPLVAKFAGDPSSGLIVLTGPMATVQRDVFIALAARHRLPAVYGYRFYATSGGLASYGIDNLDLYRRAGSYVDRILKGTKPADLPVQQPTKFELVVNLKTAKTLGLTVPEAFLLRADEVIE